MPFNSNGLNAAVNGIAAAGTYISGHTADPSTGGSNEVTGGSYARQQTTWGSASGGERVGSQVTVPIPAGTTVAYWGLWSAVSGGTFLGGFQLSAPEVFGSAGNWLHTPTLDANAS